MDAPKPDSQADLDQALLRKQQAAEKRRAAREAKRQSLIRAGTDAAIVARENWCRKAKFHHKSRGAQIIPDGGDWLTYIFRSGRGWGKTACQTQWLFDQMWAAEYLIGHAVGPTISDMEGTLMLGPSGFRSVIPAECLRGGSWEKAYRQNNHTIKLTNGSRIRGFGATDGGGKLRGPQCHAGIGDELREWDKPAGMLKEAFSNFEFGVRLPWPAEPGGYKRPARIVCGTTPKGSITFLKELYKTPGVVVVTGSTYENMENLDEAFKRRLLTKEGTIIGRVEIHGEDIDLEEFAIFKRSWLKLWPPHKPFPEFSFVILSIDTASEKEDYDVDEGKRDYSACAVLGIFDPKRYLTAEELKKFNWRGKWAAMLADFWMEKVEFPDLLEMVRKAYRTRYGKPGRYPDVVLIESANTGISLRQQLQAYNVPCWPFSSHGQSKDMRAHAVSPIVKQGMLWIPESDYREKEFAHRKGYPRTWAEPLVDQLCTFSGEGSTEYDDAVDVTTQGLIYFMDRGMLTAVPQTRTFPDPDEAEAIAFKKAEEQRRKEKGRKSAYGA